VTNNTGEYSLSISGVQYPQKSLSAINNKSGILQELRKTIGSIYDKTNSMSINTVEFSQIDSTANRLHREQEGNQTARDHVHFGLHRQWEEDLGRGHQTEVRL
jgi:hypothetical protein